MSLPVHQILLVRRVFFSQEFLFFVHLVSGFNLFGAVASRPHTNIPVHFTLLCVAFYFLFWFLLPVFAALLRSLIFLMKLFSAEAHSCRGKKKFQVKMPDL